MTRRRPISQALLDRVAATAARSGLAAEIEVDGTRVAPHQHNQRINLANLPQTGHDSSMG